jgi:hypothetical protein
MTNPNWRSFTGDTAEKERQLVAGGLPAGTGVHSPAIRRKKNANSGFGAADGERAGQ